MLFIADVRGGGGMKIERAAVRWDHFSTFKVGSSNGYIGSGNDSIA
jgi:hypothetical protein